MASAASALSCSAAALISSRSRARAAVSLRFDKSARNSCRTKGRTPHQLPHNSSSSSGSGSENSDGTVNWPFRMSRRRFLGGLELEATFSQGDRPLGALFFGVRPLLELCSFVICARNREGSCSLPNCSTDASRPLDFAILNLPLRFCLESRGA